MSLRRVVFADLDDTLFQTARKMTPASVAGASRVATALNGSHGYMTPVQAGLLNWLGPAEVVPVTARGSDAFSRVALAFGDDAVLANGAVILRDGVPDPAWEAHMMQALAPWTGVLDALPGLARDRAEAQGAQVRAWLVEEPGLGGCYAVAKVEPGTPEAALATLAPDLRATVTPDWGVHLSGNNLALVPPGVSKAAAVAHLLHRLREGGEVLAVGVGDSASDLGFMRLCDLWMTPSGSQIDRGIRAE
jgi:hypothetical protein